MKAERAAWREEFAGIDPSRLVFVDESGASTAMDRTHGRAPSGVRVDGPVPHGHWKVVTLTAAVRLGGVPESACLAFDGATNAACFEAYVGECLVPALRPGDIVVMDNLSSHKGPRCGRLSRRPARASASFRPTVPTSIHRERLRQTQGAAPNGRRTHRRAPLGPHRPHRRHLHPSRMRKLLRRSRLRSRPIRLRSSRPLNAEKTPRPRASRGADGGP